MKPTITVLDTIPGDRIFAAFIDANGSLSANTILGIWGWNKVLIDVNINEVPEKGIIRVNSYPANAYPTHIYRYDNRHQVGEYVGFHLTRPIDNNITWKQCYIPLIDKVAISEKIESKITYVSDKQVVIRVRNYGFKPLETQSSIKKPVVVTAARKVDLLAEETKLRGLFFVKKLDDYWVTCTTKDIYEPDCVVHAAIIIRNAYLIIDNQKNIVGRQNFNSYEDFIDIDDVSINSAQVTVEQIPFGSLV